MDTTCTLTVPSNKLVWRYSRSCSPQGFVGTVLNHLSVLLWCPDCVSVMWLSGHKMKASDYLCTWRMIVFKKTKTKQKKNNRLLLSYWIFLESSTDFQQDKEHIRLAQFSRSLPLMQDGDGCCVPQIDLMLDEHSK